MGLLSKLLRKPAPAPADAQAQLMAQIDALNDDACAAMTRMQWQDAYKALRAAHELAPDNVPVLVNLGVVFRETRQFDQARAVLDHAAQQMPGFAPIQFNLALVADALGEADLAMQLFRRTLALDPLHVDALQRLYDLALVRDDKPTQQEVVRQTIALGTHHPSLRHRAAVLLSRTSDRQQAVDWLEQTLAAHAEPEAACTLGRIRRERRDYDGARACYDLAISLAPEYHQPKWETALMDLQTGRFEVGWAAFRTLLAGVRGRTATRTEPDVLRAHFGETRDWHGEALNGQHILVWTEWGLGDSLMLMRYLPHLKTQWGAGRVSVLCEPTLEPLMRLLPGVDDVVAKTTPMTQWPHPDRATSLLLLPAFDGARPGHVPPAPYLQPPVAAVASWRERLVALGPGLKVGLCWSGSRILYDSRLRNLTLGALRGVLEVPGVHWVSLQQGGAAKERPVEGISWHDWMADCPSLQETAALTAALDLVISVDTAIAHLAGALNVPVWMLSRYGGEWRWGTAQETSYWYSAMRIFTQTAEDDWTHTLSTLAQALGARAAA